MMTDFWDVTPCSLIDSAMSHRIDDRGSTSEGLAMAQVVSRRPLTAEARVRVLVIPCGICG
jgi:hypothetical protein